MSEITSLSQLDLYEENGVREYLIIEHENAF